MFQCCSLACVTSFLFFPSHNRYLFLKKVPTRRKLLSAVAVVLGLFISLIPTFYPHIDPRAVRHLGGATGAGRVLWPLAFMLGFVSQD